MAGLNLGASSITWALKNKGRSTFMGEENGTKVARRIECKESRIGKVAIQVPSNVNVTLEGKNVTVKGPLGELSQLYPSEVKVERDPSGFLKVSKVAETRRANQMHGLFRHCSSPTELLVYRNYAQECEIGIASVCRKHL